MNVARGLALALAVSLVPACGARTGLGVPRLDGGPDAPSDAGVDAPALPDAPPICVPGEFAVVPASADVVFVIDRSGSMRLTLEGVEDQPPETWRWRVLRDAVDGALGSLDARVRVGAKFYPDPIPAGSMDIPPEVACRSTRGLEVPIAAGAAPAVVAAFDANDPLGGTPTALAIAAAAEALRASSSSRRFLVLATDGAPNCNPETGVDPSVCVCSSRASDCLDPRIGPYSCLDDVRTLDILDRTLRVAGIPVFVVGIEDTSRPDLADVLDRMALAGGRARDVAGERRFYPVRTGEDLRAALDLITSTIPRCAFVSPSVPVDDSTFSLTLDGRLVTRDPANGWAWTDRERGELELFGAACEAALRPGAEVVAVVDECPF